MTDTLLLLSEEEVALRTAPVISMMGEAGIDGALITDNANIYYLTGRVFSGYIYLTADGATRYYVKRPVGLKGERVVYIRKPEDIPSTLPSQPATIGLELDVTPYSTVQRLGKAMSTATLANVSGIMRQARSVKTPREIDLIRQSGVKHDYVYHKIPGLYEEGMTDIDLQIAVERLSRQEGCVGQFRISGDSMELFMGNVIAGDNADAPSPYDFAMGGAGVDPSLPVGANGTELRRGMSVMVDMNGNFNGYMTDMTRTFAIGDISEEAQRAHNLSIAIHRELAAMGRPGMAAKDMYARALAMVEEAGLGDFYMGHKQKAGFIGHGIGIEVNELPVIAPRSRDTLAEGNVIALEPKFVIPHVGAVGIENTYEVTPSGMVALNHAPEQIINLL